MNFALAVTLFIPPILLIVLASQAPLLDISKLEYWFYVFWMLVIYFANWLTSVWVFGSNRPTSRLFAALPSISIVTALGSLLIYGCLIARWVGYIGYTNNVLANIVIAGLTVMICSIVIISSKSAETHSHQVTKTELITRIGAIKSLTCNTDTQIKAMLNSIKFYFIDEMPHPSKCNSERLDDLVLYLDKLKEELRDGSKLHINHLDEIQRIANTLAK
ncbi:MAG: hypothetical protein ACI83W_002499 [Marinoscillum sp.]